MWSDMYQRHVHKILPFFNFKVHTQLNSISVTAIMSAPCASQVCKENQTCLKTFIWSCKKTEILIKVEHWNFWPYYNDACSWLRNCKNLCLVDIWWWIMYWWRYIHLCSSEFVWCWGFFLNQIPVMNRSCKYFIIWITFLLPYIFIFKHRQKILMRAEKGVICVINNLIQTRTSSNAT